MNREDIIRMAQKAGYGPSLSVLHVHALERFAALVISHHVKETRPEVSDSMATWLQQIAYQHGGIGDLSSTEMEFGAMVAAAEREACAKVCERLPAQQDIDVRDQCAAAIRARGDV
jgi:hypothetical protein